MLPAPARCLGVAASSKASGKFRRDGSGVVLDVTVTLPQSGAAQSNFTGVAGAWPGQVVSSSFNGSKTVANVRLRPGTGASASANAGVQLSITCAGGAGTLNVVATFSAPPSESTTPTFTLHDF